MKNREVYKKIGLKAVCVVVGASLFISPAVMAAGSRSPQSSQKEEVVYGNLDGSGKLSDISVVNIFDVQNGKITDYGFYDDVRNMTTTDSINVSGDQISISTEADRLYYEGDLNAGELPWTFDIKYYIDGKQYSPQNVAGQSGKLKIKMSIRQNPACDEYFFDNYTLQVSLTLDTKQAKNIQADGATLANVGSDCQVTYTILPGNEKDIEVIADVTDFEMSGISANGLPLSMDIDVDDGELMDQVDDLLEAIADLDDGAAQISDGAAELEDQTRCRLADGSNKVAKGAVALNSGALELAKSGKTIAGGANELNQSAKMLSDGADSLKSGVDQAGEGIDALDGQSSKLTGGSAQVSSALGQMQSSVNGGAGRRSESSLVSSSYEIRGAVESLAEGLAEVSNVVAYEYYTTLLKENGIDTKALTAANSDAIESLDTQINSLNAQKGQVDKAINDLLQIPEGSEGYDDAQQQIAVLREQSSTLQTTIESLYGLRQLLQANNDAWDGVDQINQAYFNSLTGTDGALTKLTDGAAQLKEMYGYFDAGISKLSDSLNELKDQYGKFDKGVNSYTDGVSALADSYGQIEDGAESLAEGAGALQKGTEALCSGASEYLQGIRDYYDATGTLKDGTGELDEGVAELIAGLAQLNEGAAEMKDGTGEMREETDGMDTEISDQIDELLDMVSGPEGDVKSFVSDDNTDVSAVQFVIKTESIDLPEEEEAQEASAEPEGFFQKLLDLFRK